MDHTCEFGGCVEFAVLSRPPERFVSLSIKDDLENVVGAALLQDADEDGSDEVVALVCGESRSPVRISPGRPLTVVICEGVLGSSCPSVASAGTVTATFGETLKAAEPKKAVQRKLSWICQDDEMASKTAGPKIGCLRGLR